MSVTLANEIVVVIDGDIITIIITKLIPYIKIKMNRRR